MAGTSTILDRRGRTRIPAVMCLSAEYFRPVVTQAPLVSIVLLIEDSPGQVLLGRRVNPPAQGYWFVPGGRIRKNESLDEAFRHLTISELGVAFERGQAGFLGVDEHFYRDSVYGENGPAPDTHYVVLCYHQTLPVGRMLGPLLGQHDRYRWWRTAKIENWADVHYYTGAYLQALSRRGQQISGRGATLDDTCSGRI